MDPHYSFIRILIRIRVKRWIRIRTEVKILELYRFKMEPWMLTIEPWMVCGPLIADSSFEEQDPVRGRIKLKRWTRIRIR
jgi:hypothetical protein